MAGGVMEQRDVICGICPAGCFVRATLEDGRLTRVKAREDHRLGMICTIGKHSPEIVYDPDRIKTPLKRVGNKGRHDFEAISWEQAFDIIEDRFKEIKSESGPEATAIYTGRGGFELSLCDIYQPRDVAISSASSVLFPFGSPNTLGVGALCYVSFAMIAPHVTFGEYHFTTEIDLEHADLVVIWGANPATDSPPTTHHKIVAAAERGAEVIAIDPRRNDTARAVGARWLPVRPGTDGALALSMIQVLVEEELYDEDFVRRWTLGFEKLTRYTQHFRPELVSKITGLDADEIRHLARKLAHTRGAAPVMYTGLEYSDSGVQAIRAVFTLFALAGHLDMPGGLCIRMRDSQFPINRGGLQANPDITKSLGRTRFPVYSMYRGESHASALPESVLEGKPYPIRALMILGGSVITAWPNPQIWKQTMAELDFLVTVDRHLTADAAYADLVLPATTMYEIDSYMVYGPLFSRREKVVEPVGEARDDFHILGELAQRLGYGHLYPQSDRERLEYILKGSGFTVEDLERSGGTLRVESPLMQYKKWEKGLLREDGAPGFNTPSGKFEICSSILEEHGYDGLPVYTEPGEGPLARPDLAQDFPLVFNSGARIFADFRSQHHGVAKLSQGARDPRVSLNTNDAKDRGIHNGDWVWLRSPRGHVKLRARVTEDIVPGAIDANMGGGGPLGSKSWQEANINALTDLTRCDPISGFPVYKALLCQVHRAEPGGEAAVDDMAFEDSPTPKPPRVGAKRREVYLDFNATTALAPAVLDAMRPFLTDEAINPSAIHSLGVKGRDAMESARRKLAALLNCTARRLVFTAGGSEANNLAIKGAALTRRARGNHLITTAVEHLAVLKSCEGLAELGFETTILPVDHNGVVSPGAVHDALRENTVLVSVLLANNELGTIEQVRKIAEICRARGVWVHSDAVQALGKIPVDVEELGVDLLSVSGHKLHGPKGVGALYVARGVELFPLVHGGDQEHGLRGGTENVAGIVGFGEAAELAMQRFGTGKLEEMAALRDELEGRMGEIFEGARVNGAGAARTPNTTNLLIPGMRGESLVLTLDPHGVYFSSGSACKSGHPDPSHVLRAIGLSDDEAHCCIRLSLGVTTTRDELDHVYACFERALRDSRTAVQFAGCR